jgi:putative mRNA 3-end processing factor
MHNKRHSLLMTQKPPAHWITPLPVGIYIPHADVWIDPNRPVARALVTHGHADHARGGHGCVWATPETLAIMAVRYGPQAQVDGNPGAIAMPYGTQIEIAGVRISFHSAGHVLGSAQIRLEYEGDVVVVSGDYKRRADPSCAPFEVVPCDIFITEATFALPVFRHPDTKNEMAKLVARAAANPDRCVLVGAYALGKAQRVITELRAIGYTAPLYIHGALEKLCTLYQSHGVDLGDIRPVAGVDAAELLGQIILAPPSALADRWSRRLPDPVTAMASGWMRVRGRARQRGVELPLIVSDHADWDELTHTLLELRPKQVWITHGRDDALVHWCALHQISARALALVGREDEDD